MYICSAKKDGNCKVSGVVAPRMGGCCHSRPHPADGRDLNNSAGEIGTPYSETDAPCREVGRNVTCVPVEGK